MLGPSKYDKLLSSAKEEAKATSGILILIDGQHGPGMACQLTMEIAKKMPGMLRILANAIESEMIAQNMEGCTHGTKH